MTPTITPSEVKSKLLSGCEIALLDVREEGVFAMGHLLFARSVPLSRLELLIGDLVPRKATPIVLCDDGDGMAARAAARLGEFGYDDLAILDGGIRNWAEAGNVLFSGVFVPSKAFGEFVEATCHPTFITPEDLQRKLDSNEDVWKTLLNHLQTDKNARWKFKSTVVN